MLISTNSATGVSLNFSPELTCQGSRCSYCYAERRSKAEAAKRCERLGLPEGTITANNGPITWPIQQECYRQNTLELMRMSPAELEAKAKWLTKCLHLRHYDNIRVPGCGDLFTALVHLCTHLSIDGIKVYGFTRKAQALRYLAECMRITRLPANRWPSFRVSVDRWTKTEKIKELLDAAWQVNGADKRVIAYMALPDEKPVDIRNAWWFQHCSVVLGYHATGVHTTVRIARECPKTAQKGVTCQECRRCLH